MRIVVVSLLCCVYFTSLIAQQSEPMTFQDQMEVRIIRVEAVVTDRQGDRVKGLSQEDFSLIVDGQEATTAYFREVNDVVYDGSVMDLPAGIESMDPMDDPETHEGVSYLVFFDDYFTKRNYRQGLIDRVEAQLDLMRPQDEMAIVRFDGTRLHLLNRWTQSQSALRQSLRELRRTKPGELKREARLSMPQQNTSFINDKDDYFSAMQILSGQIKEAVSAATIAMRSVPDPQGRKVMLLASSGWPHRLDRSINGVAGQTAQDSGDTTPLFNLEDRFLGQGLLNPLSDTANVLSYTIYPLQVDAPSSQASAALDSPTSQAGAEFQSFSNSSSPFSNLYDSSYESLSFLAENTGGQLINNAGSRPNPFERVVADTTSYYVLAFYVPENLNPGARHKIEVKLANDDLKVRHRKHYRIQSATEENRMQMEAALLLNEYRQDMSIHLAAPDRGWTTMKQAFWLKIPADKLRIRETRDGEYQADVDLRIMVEDKRGDRSNLSEMPISFKVKERPEPGKFFVYNATLKLRKTKHVLVFSVSDRNGDASLMLHVPYDPEMFEGIEGSP